ncbi:MAG: tRNA lysidine(34) synthetase TilS [Bacteroidales bacterium]
MREEFDAYLKKEGLCSPSDQLLLAVSGGVDSVVMAHLFRAAGYHCALAHCNFQLRGKESDADEMSVRSLSDYLEYPVYVKRFDVEGTISEQGGSVQMVARELRYQWFQELAVQHGFDAIATAHNLNDSIETFFLNLIRGTGIRGLLGIPAKNRNVIRPLLFSTRKAIMAYARRQQITFREDASNLETKYTRNKIRHDLLPVMEQIHPGIEDTMAMNMQRLQEVESIFINAVETERERLFVREGDQTCVEIGSLRSLAPLGTWLYELFSPFGFSSAQCAGIEQMMNAPPGSRSVSPTHQLFKDRDRLILVKSQVKEVQRYYLDSPELPSSLPFSMDIEIVAREQLKKIPGDPLTACLDFDTIQFPLTLRHWLHGDYFYPLGMDQMKKISDFFVDNKVPVPDKERAWILASGRKIVWIIGYRIDHRYRITDQTRKVLILRVQSDVPPELLKKSP